MKMILILKIYLKRKNPEERGFRPGGNRVPEGETEAGFLPKQSRLGAVKIRCYAGKTNGTR